MVGILRMTLQMVLSIVSAVYGMPTVYEGSSHFDGSAYSSSIHQGQSFMARASRAKLGRHHRIVELSGIEPLTS